MYVPPSIHGQCIVQLQTADECGITYGGVTGDVPQWDTAKALILFAMSFTNISAPLTLLPNIDGSSTTTFPVLQDALFYCLLCTSCRLSASTWYDTAGDEVPACLPESLPLCAPPWSGKEELKSIIKAVPCNLSLIFKWNLGKCKSEQESPLISYRRMNVSVSFTSTTL